MPIEEAYDVAIVGGGLAGLSLAILCADAGRKVVIYEKEQYPYHKVCGEYISLESWNFLKRIGADLETTNLPIIKRLQLSDPSGNCYNFKLPLGGFGISRYFLDNQLYQVAVAKGVTVLTNTKVNNVEFIDNGFVVTSAKDTINSKVVVGAFGKRSNIDVKWNRSFTTKKPNALNNYIGIKYHIRYSHDKNTIALHNFKDGYCGISRIEDDKSCLCYLTTAKNLKECGNSVKEMEQHVLNKNPRLKEIFTTANFLFEQPLAISQVSFNKKAQVEKGVLMVGDAAGMITPLCGNGMSMAMHSAKIAFEVIQRFLCREVTREQMEKEYSYKWSQAFSKRLFIGRVVQTFFGADSTTSLFLQAMNLIPPIARQVIRATHGNEF